MEPTGIEKEFDWDVTVIDSEQVNAFCLPGGKMAVYTGLVPVAGNADAMAMVMGPETRPPLLRHGAHRRSGQKRAQIGQMAGAASGRAPRQMRAWMQGDATGERRGHRR